MPPDTTKPALQQIGNYDLIVKLAEGGMGAVYKGRSRATGEIVAIKVIPATTAKNPVLLARFEQEFRAASLIDHVNVVKAIEYSKSGPSPFLVMEFVDGESLGQRIEREGAIPEDEALRLIAQVCQGLHRAHKNGLIHRDVKPDNIMVTRDGVAKLTDLGLVKDVGDDQNLTRTGRGLGTPHYMAPEQFRNAKNADVRCDIYSLGATLYAMVTGIVPFGKVGPLDCWMKKIRNDFDEPRVLKPELSERIDWAIRRAMSGDPEKRPNNCREFVEDLHGQTIRPPTNSEAANTAGDVWYLVYKDETGESHTVKGTTEGIRRAIKDDLLGDASNIRACRTKTGPFTPLTTYPEFRDIVVEPAPMPNSPPASSTNIRPSGSGSGSTPGGWKAPSTPAPGSMRSDPDAVDLGAKGGITRGPRSNAHLTPTVEAPRASGQRPLIRLQPAEPLANNNGSGKFPWWMWLLLGTVAAATAVIVVLLLKK